jgi:hypothetical protein
MNTKNKVVITKLIVYSIEQVHYYNNAYLYYYLHE